MYLSLNNVCMYVCLNNFQHIFLIFEFPLKISNTSEKKGEMGYVPAFSIDALMLLFI